MCERVGSSTDVILRNSSRLLALTVFRQQLRQECLFACRGEFTQPYARDTWRCFSLHPLFTLPFRARRTRGLRHKRHGIHVICRASAIIFPLKLRWLLFKDASPVERITLKCDIEDTLHFTRCRWHSKKHYFKKRLWRINNHIFSYSEGLNSLWKGFFFFFFFSLGNVPLPDCWEITVLWMAALSSVLRCLFSFWLYFLRFLNPGHIQSTHLNHSTFLSSSVLSPHFLSLAVPLLF